MFRDKKKDDELYHTYYNTGYEQGKQDLARKIKSRLDCHISKFENTYTTSGLEIAKLIVDQCLLGDISDD